MSILIFILFDFSQPFEILFIFGSEHKIDHA